MHASPLARDETTAAAPQFTDIGRMTRAYRRYPARAAGTPAPPDADPSPASTRGPPQGLRFTGPTSRTCLAVAGWRSWPRLLGRKLTVDISSQQHRPLTRPRPPCSPSSASAPAPQACSCSTWTQQRTAPTRSASTCENTCQSARSTSSGNSTPHPPAPEQPAGTRLTLALSELAAVRHRPKRRTSQPPKDLIHSLAMLQSGAECVCPCWSGVGRWCSRARWSAPYPRSRRSDDRAQGQDGLRRRPAHLAHPMSDGRR